MKNTFFLLLIFVANIAHAGKELGNGGMGIACYDNSQKLISARSLDLWEGEILFNARPLAQLNSATAIAHDQVVKLEQVMHIGPTLQNRLEYLQKNWKWLPSGVRLQPTV